MNYQKEQFKSYWQSPSNIALVKYWGKKAQQIPCNPSISFTLNQAISDTSIEAEWNANQSGLSFEFYFENQKNDKFEEKLLPFLQQISKELKWMNNFHLKINSKNTFPHSSGIASSASAYSALALNLLTLDQEIGETPVSNFLEKASFWARIGSGSACRSVYGGYNLWGKTASFENSNDEFAINIDTIIHNNFKNINDTILIVEKGQKSVSSTTGHALLNQHPFAEKRYETAFKNTELLIEILKKGEIMDFINLVESEALMLHALMMSSPSAFILMKPNTLKIIELIQQHRKEQHVPIGFTLDAGANVHFLNLDVNNQTIKSFVETELKPYCQNGLFFENQIGKGPIQINQ